MKILRSISKLLLAVLVLACSFTAFAQKEAGSKRIPEGTWELDGITAFEQGVQVYFSADSIGFEAPQRIDIQSDELIFVYKETSEKVAYNLVASETTLCFPVCAEWRIVEGKLLLEWGQDMNSQRSMADIRTVTLSYNRK